MLYASSQAPDAFYHVSDRGALSECFPENSVASEQNPASKARVRLGRRKSDDIDTAAIDADEERRYDGILRNKVGDAGIGEDGISDDRKGVASDELISNQEANNLTIDTQVNPFNYPDTQHSDRVLSREHTHDAALQVNQLQARLQQQQQIRQVERQIHSSLRLPTLFRVVVVEMAKLFNAQQSVLMQYQADQQQWAPVAQYCQNQSIAWRKLCQLKQEEFPDLTRQLFQGEIVSLFGDQPLPTTETRQWLACYPGSWLILPISMTETDSAAHTQPSGSQPSGSQIFGVDDSASHWGILAIALPEQHCWISEEISCVESLVMELSAAIAKAEQYQRLLTANQALQKLALSDGLTGLANRRRFDEHLVEEWQRLARDRQPLSLILCDLDHFKLYNDTFGHPAGDRCLAKVAVALKKGPRRPADLVARYGGEEFAIILPNTDTKGAWRIAQKLHHAIRSLKIAHATDAEKSYVTVTMGVSTIIPGHNATAQVLVQAADLALYHAKKQGRDRTYVHAHYNTVNMDAQQASTPGESPLDMTPLEPSL